MAFKFEHAIGSFRSPRQLSDYIVRLQQTVRLHCPITTNCPITLYDYNFAGKFKKKENTEVYEPITFEEIVIVMISGAITISKYLDNQKLQPSLIFDCTTALAKVERSVF